MQAVRFGSLEFPRGDLEGIRGESSDLGSHAISTFAEATPDIAYPETKYLVTGTVQPDIFINAAKTADECFGNGDGTLEAGELKEFLNSRGRKIDYEEAKSFHDCLDYAAGSKLQQFLGQVAIGGGQKIGAIVIDVLEQMLPTFGKPTLQVHTNHEGLFGKGITDGQTKFAAQGRTSEFETRYRMQGLTVTSK